MTTPPIAKIKRQVRQRDFTVDPALRQLHIAYRFLTAEFPRLRVESGVLVLVDHSDASHTCPVIPNTLVTRVLEIAHPGPDSAHLGYMRLKAPFQHLFSSPSMKIDGRIFVASCPACLSFQTA